MMTNIFSLEGKTAVVIGGTSGIGRILSLGLADAGADVIASGRRRELVDETAIEIERRGRQTLRLCSDACKRASLGELRAASLQRFGKVDILINSAGIIKRMPSLTMPEEEWADILNTNLTGTLRACQIFGEHMLERGNGRVVNVASLNSFVAFSEVAAYAASKSGVLSLTRSLAVEWSKKGFTVKRNRARCLPHSPECRPARQRAARPGVVDADADRPLRQNRRTRRSCRLSLLRCRFVRYWTDSGHRRRFSCQRSQPIAGRPIKSGRN
jgi:NADP-dependent 3-hydroxy acid dehydrogenase YdfG